tara:strand:- start:1017 stop:1232 length:216 start_codon:yes stop_codon:yes gene_type:complete
MLTRSQCTEILLERGYVRDDYPGIWIKDNNKYAWFIAVQKEGLKFDSKSWGPEITEVKRRWKERKKNGLKG